MSTVLRGVDIFKRNKNIHFTYLCEFWQSILGWRGNGFSIWHISPTAWPLQGIFLHAVSTLSTPAENSFRLSCLLKVPSSFSTGSGLLLGTRLPAWFIDIPLDDLKCRNHGVRPSFWPLRFGVPIFDQVVPLHGKCNVNIRLWEGHFPTHRIKALLKFIFPVQCQDPVNPPPTMIILGAVKAPNKFHVLKHFPLTSIGWTGRRIYILSRLLDSALPFPTRRATSWRWLILLSLRWAWPCHVCLFSHLYTRLSSYHVKKNIGDFF